MEHSYSKDVHPKGNVEVMATRSILIPRPPQCPSCHQHATNDDIITKFENQHTDPHFDQLPPLINDNIAKMAMDETDRLTKNVKNNNADDEDWDLKVEKFGWTKQQINLYRQVSNILDYDQLARLAVNGRGNEGIIRRCIVDKSVARMRQALASVHWDIRLTQWLHGLLSEHLPNTYMTSYLDILQTLRTKVPTLVDKMLLNRPLNQDYMQAVMKRPWGANVPTKSRKLPGQSPIIVIIPATLNSANQQQSSRMKRWCSLLGTMASIAPIQNSLHNSCPLDQVSEQLVAITRSKIQDLRNEMPNRHIILVGINAGAAVALQVALVENVSSIVCMGLAFNTVKGVRGAPDDRILDITIPVLFVLGENSARSSQEEIESLRERMSAQTSLVVVGSADDSLRINKFNRHLEGVTQSMVDNMIADEVQDFVSTCIMNPPGPREITNKLSQRTISGASGKKESKKRKHKDSKEDKGPPRKVGRPRLNRTNEMPTGKYKPEKPKPTSALLKQSSESLKLIDQSISSVSEIVTLKTPDVADDVVVNTTPIEQQPIAKTIEAIDTTVNASFETSSNDQSAETISAPTSPLQNVQVATPIISSTPKILQFNNQFIHLKKAISNATQQSPPKRMHSPNMKKILVQKNVPKKTIGSTKPTSQTFFTTTTVASMGGVSTVPPNKQIFIKSQQILVPPSNVKKIGTEAAAGTIPTIIPAVTTANDLSGLLDLPILFADNDGTIIDQNTQMATIPTTSNMRIINTAPADGSSANILITSPEGKLPNRPVVISAAKIAKSSPQTTTIVTTTTPSPSNRVIFINRGQMKSQMAVTNPGLKTMSTLKLVPTSAPNTSTAQNVITKLTPGTKIDLSTLKIIKDSSVAATSGAIVTTKPTFQMIGKAQPAARNTFFIKSPGGMTLQTHPAAMQSNRNITVRKVMNLVPQGTKQTIPTPASIAGTNKVNILTTTVVTNATTGSPKQATPIKKS